VFQARAFVSWSLVSGTKKIIQQIISQPFRGQERYLKVKIVCLVLSKSIEDCEIKNLQIF
jgi:hypothetical protein